MLDKPLIKHTQQGVVQKQEPNAIDDALGQYEMPDLRGKAGADESQNADSAPGANHPLAVLRRACHHRCDERGT